MELVCESYEFSKLKHEIAKSVAKSMTWLHLGRRLLTKASLQIVARHPRNTPRVRRGDAPRRSDLIHPMSARQLGPSWWSYPRSTPNVMTEAWPYK